MLRNGGRNVGLQAGKGTVFLADNEEKVIFATEEGLFFATIVESISFCDKAGWPVW